MFDAFFVAVAAAVASPGAQVAMEFLAYRIRLAFVAPSLLEHRDAEINALSKEVAERDEKIVSLERQVGDQAAIARRAEQLVAAIGAMREVSEAGVRKAG